MLLFSSCYEIQCRNFDWCKSQPIVKNAKPIPKYSSQASNSIPAPPQSPPTPSFPACSPPSPTPPPAPHKANPTLLLSTLHRNPSFSSEPRVNTSKGSSYGSDISGIGRLDVLNETQVIPEEPSQTLNERIVENVVATSNFNPKIETHIYWWH